MDYVVGVDGGGTGCRAAIADRRGTVLAQARSGPANIRTDLDGAHRNIQAAIEEAAAGAGLSLASLSNCVAVLGLAGGNVGDYAERLRARLPFRRSITVNDGIIALAGALGPHDGVIGIVGTGSVFAARIAGQVRMIGGWGFQVGDLASGARLGQRLLEEVLLAYDGVRRPSPLTVRIMEDFGHDPAKIVAHVREATPAIYAGLAPTLIDAAKEGDAVAEAVLDWGCRDLERMLDAIARPDTNRLCLLGGLAAMYGERIAPRYRAILKAPLGDALQGALAMAREAADRMADEEQS